VFSQPVPNLDKQVTMHYLACADAITTPDAGKTWKIKNIFVEKSNAPSQYSKGAKVSAAGGLCRK
jgi:hypothetical protein